MSESGRTRAKAIVVRGGTVVASAAGAGPLSPLVGSLMGQALSAVNRSNEKRLESLLDEAVRGGEDQALVDRLNQAFVEDGSEVFTLFVQMARAALAAVDPVVIPSIALLFRRAMSPSLEPLPRWRARQCLRLLEEVTAEEFGELATLTHAALAMPSKLGEPDRGGIPLGCGSSNAGGIEVRTAFAATGPSNQHSVCCLRDPQRVFQLLVEHRFGKADDEDWSVLVDFADLSVLADVLPR